MLCVFHHQQNALLSSKYLHEVFFFFCGLRYRYHSDTPVEKTPNHYLIQSFGCCLGEIVLLRYLQLFEHRALMIHTKYSLFNLTKKIMFNLVWSPAYMDAPSSDPINRRSLSSNFNCLIKLLVTTTCLHLLDNRLQRGHYGYHNMLQLWYFCIYPKLLSQEIALELDTWYPVTI